MTFIESRTPALHHAAPSVLECIDRVQRRFLRKVGIYEVEAFQRFKLAPLSIRRDISMFGLMYRIAHGLAPKCLCDLLPKKLEARLPSLRGERHDLQFQDFMMLGGHTNILRRSCFGLVTVWNMLPMKVVRAKSVKICQRDIQSAVLSFCLENNARCEWHDFFSSNARTMPMYVFQKWFQ